MSKMHDLVNDITLQIATNQPLSKSVMEAIEAGYSLVVSPGTMGNPNMLRVLLVDKNEKYLLEPTTYAQTHIDMGMMTEYVNGRS